MGITTTGRVGPHFALTVTQASLDLAAAITREGVDIDDKGRIMPLVATMPSGVKISIEIPESELDTASQSAIKGLRDGSVQTDLFEGRPDYVKRARPDRFVWPRVLQRLGAMQPFPLVFDFDCEDMNVNSVRGCINRAFHGLAHIKDASKSQPVFPGYICKIEQLYPKVVRVLLFKTPESDDAR